MSSDSVASRILLRPRSDTVYVSRGRTVFACSDDGSIRPGCARERLFVYQARNLCKYRWLIDREQPRLSAQSAVEQHSWLGYYFQAPPECKGVDALQQTIELRIARVVGEGMHEDVDVINHTQQCTSFTLTLEADADFASRDEVENERQQNGDLGKEWRRIGDGEWRWSFDYRDSGSSLSRHATWRLENVPNLAQVGTLRDGGQRRNLPFHDQGSIACGMALPSQDQ